MLTVLIHASVGLGLVAFGRSARRDVTKYVPVTLPEDERERRTRVVVRGAWACQVAGVVFALMVVPVFLG